VILRLVSFVTPLGFDTLAIALALGVRGGVPMWRIALVFAAFETLMPLVGIAIGQGVGARFTAIAQVVGAAVLVVLGGREIREGLESPDSDESAQLRFDTLRATILAGLAISTDELAAGFPLGVSGLPIGILLATIGLQTLVITTVGISLGTRISKGFGLRASRFAMLLAGVVFVALGGLLGWEAFYERARVTLNI
jgi:putative Mn2+ efflux pump MntP